MNFTDKLIKEILSKNGKEIKDIEILENTINYKQYFELYRGDCMAIWEDKNINIYEFAFCFKEWAFDNGYDVALFRQRIAVYQNGYERFNTYSCNYLLMLVNTYEWIKAQKD